MRRRKRLLVISNRYPCGPDDTASPFVYDFRRALERAGVEVDVVTPFYRTPADEYSYIDSSVHRFEWSDGDQVISQLPLYRPSSYVKIRRYFRFGYETASNLAQRKKFDAAFHAVFHQKTGRNVYVRFKGPQAAGFACFASPVQIALALKIQGVDRLSRESRQFQILAARSGRRPTVRPPQEKENARPGYGPVKASSVFQASLENQMVGVSPKYLVL